MIHMQRGRRESVRAKKICCNGGFSLSCAAQRGGTQSRLTESVCAALDAQSASHGARPGPELASWYAGGPSVCPATESARKNHGAPWCIERPAAGSARKDPAAGGQEVANMLGKCV